MGGLGQTNEKNSWQTFLNLYNYAEENNISHKDFMKICDSLKKTSIKLTMNNLQKKINNRIKEKKL